MSRYIWNPEGFDPCPFLPPRLYRQADAARVLVHLIEYRRLDKRLKAKECVTLQAKFLRNVIGVEYCEAIRDALDSNGVITVRRSYIVGQKSFEFKIGPRFENSPFRKFMISDKFLIRRMNKHLGRTLPNPKSPTEVKLYSWLQKLTINAPNAKEHVLAFGETSDWVRQKMISIDMLAEGYFWFTRDRFHRIHTNFTNLWSELRQFLSVNGEPIVELDIANSQPLFFGLLAVQHCKSTSENSLSIEEPRKNLVNNLSKQSLPSIPFLYDAGMQNDRHSLPKDVDHYMTLVENGEIYEFMMLKAKKPVNRESFKDDFFQHVLYAKKSYPNALTKSFRELFPTIHQILTQIKAKEPRDAPWKMQRLEADFVIDNCCRQLLTQYPTIPLLTLHDGIWTTPPCLAIVRRLVQTEFAKLGVSPLLRCRSTNGEDFPS